jgi:hypothetical protein
MVGYQELEFTPLPVDGHKYAAQQCRRQRKIDDEATRPQDRVHNAFIQTAYEDDSVDLAERLEIIADAVEEAI